MRTTPAKPRFGVSTIGIVAILTLTGAMASRAAAAPIPFDGDRWSIQGREFEFETVAGRDALRLFGASARLEGLALEDGIIEFDMLVRQERGFSGAFWRWRDENNAEQFYLRPHQSGNPDANQYQPLFNGSAGWQLYHGAGYAAPVTYRFDGWMHVKIAFQGRRAAFYIDSEQPLFTTDRLKHEPAAGSVGVYASNFAPAWFANFQVAPLPRGFGIEVPEIAVDAPPDLIRAWDVSETFDWAILQDLDELPESLIGSLDWTTLPAESDGLVNIARIRTLGPGANGAIARLVIESPTERVVPFTFGFSDVTRVYLNRALLYGGADIYQSRDYRFLGTIGFFDTVYLDLQPGRNELHVAVGENFGGWGLKGRLKIADGLRIVR